MSRLVALREIAPLRLSPPADDHWVDGLQWVPVSPTEIHLACRYFPLAVRLDRGQAKLGLLIDRAYLAHDLLTAEGKWRGAYRPIALRCFPFQAPQLGNDPLADIMAPIDSQFLSQTAGVPAQVGGKPNDWVIELHRLFRLLKAGEDSFAGVIDQLFIADLLRPLAGAEDAVANETADLFVVSPRRAAELNNKSLAAMVRHNFLSLDVVVACLFSLQNLKPDYRPKPADPQVSSGGPLAAFEAIVISDLPLALDDGELVPLSELVPALAG